MKGYCITFRSVTFAQQGQRLLQQAHIACQLLRTPRWMEERGCGYCLNVPQGQGAEAAQLLGQNDIGYKKVYWLAPGGEAREVVL